MRAIDIFLRILTVVIVIGTFFLSDKLASALFCVSLFSVGLWSVMFPSGPMGWAKTFHDELDPSDESLWWVSRLVGAVLISMALLFAIFLKFR